MPGFHLREFILKPIQSLPRDHQSCMKKRGKIDPPKDIHRYTVFENQWKSLILQHCGKLCRFNLNSIVSRSFSYFPFLQLLSFFLAKIGSFAELVSQKEVQISIMQSWRHSSQVFISPPIRKFSQSFTKRVFCQVLLVNPFPLERRFKGKALNLIGNLTKKPPLERGLKQLD